MEVAGCRGEQGKAPLPRDLLTCAERSALAFNVVVDFDIKGIPNAVDVAMRTLGVAMSASKSVGGSLGRWMRQLYLFLGR